MQADHAQLQDMLAQAFAEAQAAEQRLAAIITHNADGMIVVDNEGLVRFVNPAAVQLLERSDEQLVGLPFGFPVVGSDRTEIEIISQGRASCVAEMRVVETTWAGTDAYLISLRDVTEQKRIREELYEAEAFSRAILNSLPTSIAVLDERGIIVAVNEAWIAFAAENGDPQGQMTGVGRDYFAICRQAMADGDEAMGIVLDGMEHVLSGAWPSFEHEYPCDSPATERWFLMRVVPLAGLRRRGLVVSHIDITAQRLAARVAAEAEALRIRLAEQERELSAVARLARSPRPPAITTPQLLRERDPALFDLLTARYATLLDQALAQRVYGSSQVAENEPRELAEQLGEQEAMPRDVIELHLAAMKLSAAGATTRRVQALIEEGRVLVLEVMGHLAAHYRAGRFYKR